MTKWSLNRGGYRWSQEQVSLHGAGTVLYVGMGGYGVPTTGNAPWSTDCTIREAWWDMGCLRQVMLHGAGTVLCGDMGCL